MKKSILFLLGVLPFAAFATHEYGAQVSSRYLSAAEQEIKINIWVDSGSVVSPSVTYKWQGGGAVVNNTAALSTNTSLGNAILELVYLDTVNMNAASGYKAIYESCCRKQSISNVNMPATQSLYVYTEILNPAPAIINSTPEFVNSPLFFSAPNDSLVHNPTGVDIDGDSLVYAYVVPMGANGTALPMSPQPYPAGAIGWSFNVDTLTGEIRWIPSMTGDYVYALKVEEYRNGVLIGRSVRDAMFTICVGCKTTMATSFQFYNTNTWPVNGSNYQFNAVAGAPFNVTFDGGVSGMTSNQLALDMIGEADFHPNAPSMSSTQTASNVSGIYSWTPTVAQVRNRPYLNVLIGKESNAGLQNRKKERTILVKVNAANPTNVSQNIENQFVMIYPNPAGTEFSLQVDNRNNLYRQLNIVNTLGQSVYRQSLQAGAIEAALIPTSGWATGTYYLQLSGQQLRTEKLLIQR